MPGDNGWNEYEKLVLSKLDGLEKGLECVRTDIRSIEKEVLTLKIKAGLWGLVAGALAGGGPAVVAFIIWIISR
jgi:hypothetical protein